MSTEIVVIDFSLGAGTLSFLTALLSLVQSRINFHHISDIRSDQQNTETKSNP